jgi:hypothetical protein
MVKCVKKRGLVFVFDLDKTIGYFTQIAIFIEGIEYFIKRKLKKNELFKIFDIFPEIFRPDMISIFKYLKKIKRKLKCVKVMIYTNNIGPKSWVYTIKNYIEHKIKYKLFDRTIAAWKVEDKVYEKCRTSHEKTYRDLLKCGKLSNEAKICFLDDMKHNDMKHKNVKYMHLKAYKHDILFKKMCKRFLKTNIGKLIKKSQHEEFINKLIKFAKSDPLGFTYIESTISSRKGYKKEILSELKSFVKENKHNISKKKQKKKRNRTRKLGGFW